ncbi:uncharacterized protein UV8b_05052 [Ustilaginoidea virens]|uniref:Uncharacterized protein n=1 Tax=Ustilaginoidea virens TaxID=1159556 RepID=A0A063BV19_USTVR|nr:uncharacterized protein UV8b_05052 [Ustilaginoidea virens]QUC20811.1 hypothetical protein UV8b_05052 [Ustilaginoidea virens]GAO14888.1 hypothetical protein UVI_02007270 [Ustilaginoidea virens]
MKIIWHFMVNTCSSFSVQGGNSRPVDDVMRIVVMKHAFGVQFLFKSVMALSCLHAKDSIGDDLGDPRRQSYYESGTFSEYQRAIEAADPRTFGALLANSLVITALSSRNFREKESPDLFILQWILVWRGIGVILHRIRRDALPNTGLAQLFYRPSLDLKAAFRHIPPHLWHMVESTLPGDEDFLYKATYLRCLHYLGTLYHNLRLRGFGAVMNLRIITWFTYLPAPMIDLFRKRQERALVILAHYCVFLKLVRNVWWLRGVGDRSLRDLCGYLGPEWHGAVEIPFKALFTDDPLTLARLVLNEPLWTSRRSHNDEWDEYEERETRQLSLVDDEGRRVRYEGNIGIMVLEKPSEPNEQPIWNAMENPE